MKNEQTVQTTFRERVIHAELEHLSLWMLPMPVEEVVTLQGSFYTYPDFSQGEELLQELTVQLLDKGTEQHDKFELAEMLESRGAEISFFSEELRVGFSCRMLRKDVPDVVALLAEQLRTPRFDAREFELVRAQLAAGIQRSMESTAAQAAGALSRRLYPPDHPNYMEEPVRLLERLAAYTPENVRNYYRQHFGTRSLFVVAVGDMQTEVLQKAVARHLGDWPPHEHPPRFAEKAVYAAPGRTEIPMPDRVNVDVRLGHGLPLRRTDTEFLPLYVGNFILGGNFSARLMTIVRDEMGLTYGIDSSLSGITPEYEGHWQVAVTLSQELLEQGLEATMQVVERFVEEGATAEELADKKTTITGNFQVGLASTGGIASALLTALERGFGVEYLDRFPEEVRALTLEEVNSAIRTYLHPRDVHVAIAGLPVDSTDLQS